MCRNHKFEIWNVKQTDNNEYLFYIDIEDFRLLKDIRRKTSCKIKILNKYGLPFFIYKYKIRVLFVVGVILFFLISNIMSRYIWNISLDGNYSYTSEKIINMLEKNGIKHGINKNKIVGSEIETLIRNTYPDITWVSVELKGTRLIVHIKENFDRTIVEKEDKPYNLLAGKEAVITGIVTRNGTPKVKTGDKVMPDTELVSGMLEIIGDDGSVVSRKYVLSDADVFGNVVYDYSDKFPLIHEIKQYTGKYKRALSIEVCTAGINLIGLPVKYDSFDIVSDTSQLCIFDNFYLPAYLVKYKYNEYITLKEKYTKKEAEEVANEKISRFLKDLEEKGIQIIQNNVKIEVNENDCCSSGNIVGNERLGKIQYITEDMKNQNDIEEGTDIADERD